MLACLAPDGPVYQAGTLSGNPLATAAGLAVLEVVEPAAYAALSDRVARFGAALAEVLVDRRCARRAADDDDGRPLEAQVPVVGPLFGLFFVPAGAGPVPDYDGAAASAATGLYAAVVPVDAGAGGGPGPGPYEVAFPSMAHGDAEFEHTLDVAAEAIAEAVAA